MSESALTETVEELSERIANACGTDGVQLATAESLTGGQLAAALTAAPNSGTWYRGGIVAYQPGVKYELLHAPEGTVVTAETATAMAASVAQLLGADFAAAVTGVGGPEPQEGKPAGTVYLATSDAAGSTSVEHLRFEGEPIEVMEQTIVAALRALMQRISDSAGRSLGRG